MDTSTIVSGVLAGIIVVFILDRIVRVIYQKLPQRTLKYIDYATFAAIAILGFAIYSGFKSPMVVYLFLFSIVFYLVTMRYSIPSGGSKKN